MPQLNYSKCIRLNNEISIFTAELFAILIAVEWIEEVQPIHTCICSDCLSAIQAISQPFPNNKIICDIRHTRISIKNQNNNVIFEWIPGHCGIKGNEKADQIAKKATQKCNIDIKLPLTTTEIKHKLKHNLKEQWQLEWKESKSSGLQMIQPSVSFHMNSWNLPRWQETIIHRLRLDMYNKLNNFKHKIGHHLTECVIRVMFMIM